jgi:hypothetical protein
LERRDARVASVTSSVRAPSPTAALKHKARASAPEGRELIFILSPSTVGAIEAKNVLRAAW